MNVQIEDSWKRQLSDEFEKEYFYKLTDWVDTNMPLNRYFHRAETSLPHLMLLPLTLQKLL